jgi:transposase
MTTMPQPASTQVTVGVDTHLEVHVAVVKDQLGRRLATTSVATTSAGYAELLGWATQFGPVEAWGIEGTGSFGAALSRFLRAHGQVVVEVNRPDRAARRRWGKSDSLDAEAAARTAQAQQGSMPKAGDGLVEMIRVLGVARASAMKARTQAINALKALVVTAPEELREQLRTLSTVRLVKTAAELESGAATDPSAAAKLAVQLLARRYQALTAEIMTLDAELDRLTATAAPKLLARFGIGSDSAGALLVAAGGNPARLRSDTAFAHAVWGLTVGGLLRQGPPPSPEPGWRPPSQRRVVPDRGRPPTPRPANQGLPGPPHPRGQVQEGSHPLLKALCRPRSLRRPPRQPPTTAGGPLLTLS